MNQPNHHPSGTRVSGHDCTGRDGDRARRDPGPVTYGEGPVAEEGGEVPELEREAHGEHDEAERGGVGPRRPRHEPPERLGPRDGHGGAGHDVGRVQPRGGGQRRVPPRRGRGRGGPGGREALDLEEAPPGGGEGTRGPCPRCDPGGGAPSPSGDGDEAEWEREEERSHGGRWRGGLPARGGWFFGSGARVRAPHGQECRVGSVSRRWFFDEHRWKAESESAHHTPQLVCRYFVREREGLVSSLLNFTIKCFISGFLLVSRQSNTLYI